MKRILSDAGRSSHPLLRGENNDCTVRALAHVANLSYESAHRIMAEAGRKTGRGFRMFEGLMFAQQNNILYYLSLDLPQHKRVFNGAPGFVGIDNKPILVTRFVGPNIKQFVKLHPEGRYIVKIKRHVFALIDGVIYDRYKQHAGAEVQAAYKIKVLPRASADEY